MTDEIDIPATAFEPKPWWKERPGDELIQEILGFILRTSKPHLWPGQTYNKPPKDGPITYLAEFFLKNSKPLVPCPCCTPRHPKYRHGMLAYFPNECVIRIMGHDCFKTINSEGHSEALKTFHREKQRKNDIAYLLDNLDKVPDFIAATSFAAPIGHAVDKLRNDACAVFLEVLRTDLWEHIRTGELRITKKRRQVFQIPGQGEDERDVQLTETYGTIAGQDFLKKRSRKLGVKLDGAAMAFRTVDFGPKYADQVTAMSDEDRRKTVRLFEGAIRAANESFADIHSLKQFTSASTIATLNGWARVPECPVHMHITFDGTGLYIGREEYQSRRIEVPAAYSLVLPPIPKLAHRLAAE